MLIVTYDEHGGFYDHVAPPAAQPTGSKGRKFGFTFDQLGPRVPAIIVSPRIPRNLIDHRTYEHSSIVATVARLFDLKELTGDRRRTSDLKPLATLDVPRSDAPMTLPDPMGGRDARARHQGRHSKRRRPNTQTRPSMTIRRAWIAATIASGLAQHLEVAPPCEHEAIIARVNALQTRGRGAGVLEGGLRSRASRQTERWCQRSASVRAHTDVRPVATVASRPAVLIGAKSDAHLT